MDVFYLMHRDDRVAVFAVDNDSVLSFKINGDCCELLPYGVRDLGSFKNWFGDRAILDDFSEIKTIAYKANFVPSSSLKGDLAKKWMIDSNGDRILVKGSYLQNDLQSVSEVLATA